MTTGAILWDFDGTLAIRPGLWTSCVIEVLDLYRPGHGATRADVEPFLDGRFPWHDWETVHDHLADPEAWWAPILALIADAMVGVGIPPESAPALAAKFPRRFLDPTRWRVYPDSVEALRVSRREGWRNVIVSNHVPELPALIEALGLAEHLHGIVNSAADGYEKPHPGAFRLALEAAGSPSAAWMVGDNPFADIAGAAQLGIPGILTRAPELDHASVERMDRAYNKRSRFPDWPVSCRTTAQTALEAVTFVLNVNATS